MTLPTFILAGAPKAGSSAFWHYIRQHPDIYLPDEKEPFFFDFNYHRGVAWYAAKFAGHQGEAEVGEATVWYMRWREVPERMHRVLPDVKLIFLLRNPADRAYSNFNHDYRDGRYPYDLSFSDFLLRPDRNDRGVIGGGYYADQLERFREYFADGQMLVLLTDDLRRDPAGTFRKTFEFLGVDPGFEPAHGERKNVSWWVKRLGALRAFDALWKPIEALTGFSPTKALWAGSRHFRQLLWDRDGRPPPMTAEDRATLDAHYRDNNERLARYLGRSLSEWGLPEGPAAPSET